MGNVIMLQNEKTVNYWWEQLEITERKAEDIRRILGILALEKGLEG